MKTSLDHLPARKREQVTAIAAVVRANAPVDMVILFGSYARGQKRKRKTNSASM